MYIVLVGWGQWAQYLAGLSSWMSDLIKCSPSAPSSPTMKAWSELKQPEKEKGSWWEATLAQLWWLGLKLLQIEPKEKRNKKSEQRSGQKRNPLHFSEWAVRSQTGPATHPSRCLFLFKSLFLPLQGPAATLFEWWLLPANCAPVSSCDPAPKCALCERNELRALPVCCLSTRISFRSGKLTGNKALQHLNSTLLCRGTNWQLVQGSASKKSNPAWSLSN